MTIIISKRYVNLYEIHLKDSQILIYWSNVTGSKLTQSTFSGNEEQQINSTPKQTAASLQLPMSISGEKE